MSEERYKLFGLWVKDTEEDKYLKEGEITHRLNEQDQRIKELEHMIRKCDAHRIQLLNEKNMKEKWGEGS